MEFAQREYYGCFCLSKDFIMIGPTTSFQTEEGLFAWSLTSQNVRISVVPEYVPEKSNPSRLFFVFGYTVRIQNLGFEDIQLLGRSWTITDGQGSVETVEGEGVVGEQPWISPACWFEYSSSCPLRTPTGNMRGWFHFRTRDRASFKCRIPLFFLNQMNIRH